MKLLDGEKYLKKVRLTGTEMGQLLIAVDRILEWLLEGANISQNKIYYASKEATISHNVGVTTFGPHCTLLP